jgi:hypothetical protein
LCLLIVVYFELEVKILFVQGVSSLMQLVL